MAAQHDLKGSFLILEEKIQNLIHLHEDVKKVNKKLTAENRQLLIQLDEERNKMGRIEEGYKNLKEVEKTSSRQNITTMKKKINDIILEIDRNITLIEDK